MEEPTSKQNNEILELRMKVQEIEKKLKWIGIIAGFCLGDVFFKWLKAIILALKS